MLSQVIYLLVILNLCKASYAPYEAACKPDKSEYVRQAQGLGTLEAEWVRERDKVTSRELEEWLKDSNLQDFDAAEFVKEKVPRIAFAFSGGGYRAMLCGAGQFSAFDGRQPGSKKPGHMGGLVQAATYIAGSSGGNWLVGSLMASNFSTVDNIRDDKEVWQYDLNPLDQSSYGFFDWLGHWAGFVDDIRIKNSAGFPVTITDLWGRALSDILIKPVKGSRDILFSDLRESDSFKAHEAPLPIHIATGREPNKIVLNLNSTVFEFNPFEMGSWDPSIKSFVDIKYLGTKLENGKPIDNVCVNGFDNYGFVMGTSSSFFNMPFIRIGQSLQDNWFPTLLNTALRIIFHYITGQNIDVSAYSPNPFYKMHYSHGQIAQSHTLYLSDGGFDGQNIPLHPFLQPERGVDLVFAMDNSGDTSDFWPDGSSMIATFDRQFGPQGDETVFPMVPTRKGFLDGGFTMQPGFFGCYEESVKPLFDVAGVPKDQQYMPPVIVYIANAEHSYSSNVATTELAYSTEEQARMIENGYNVASQNNGTLDSEWRTCVGCAIVLREQQRRGVEPTEQCKRCFTRYCWNGENSNSDSIERRDKKSNKVKSSYDNSESVGFDWLLSSDSSHSSSDSSAEGSLSSAHDTLSQTSPETSTENSANRSSHGSFVDWLKSLWG